MRSDPEVVARALALHALVMRARIEHAKAPADQVDRLRAWMRSAGAVPSAGEGPLHELATWEMSAIVAGSWASEPLMVLLWALRLGPLPRYDVVAPVPDEAVQRALWDGLRDAHLRPADEVEAARTVAELWHWRARTGQLVRSGFRPPKGPSMDEVVAAAGTGRVAMVDGDFEAFGKPYRALVEAEWRLAGGIAWERHRALNWLCADPDEEPADLADGGDPTGWDDTDTST